MINTNPPLGILAVRGLQPNFVNPLVHEGALTIERQFNNGFAVSGSYITSRALHLPVYLDLNLLPATATRTYNILDSKNAPVQTTTEPFYTARANLSPLVLTGTMPGGLLTTTSIVENFPGFPEGIDGFQLMQNLQKQAERFGARVKFGNLESVDFSGQPLKLNIDGDIVETKTVIVTTGSSPRDLGLDSDALRTYQRSIEIRRHVTMENLHVPEYQKGLGTVLMNCGYLLERTGRAAESMPLYIEARDLDERLIRDHPEVADYRYRLSMVFRNMGSLHEKSGRIDEAFKAAEKCRDLLEGVVRDHPEDLQFRHDLALILRWIGQVYHRRTNRHAEAIPYFRRAIELFDGLVRENPGVRTYPLGLAFSSCYLAQVLREAGHEPEASETSRKALALFEE